MTIAIDVSMLVYVGSGVARYTFNLCEAFLTQHPEHKYKLFYSSRRRPADTTRMLQDLRKKGANVIDFPFPPWFLKIIWNRFQIIPVSWLIGNYDVYHSSDFLRPPIRNQAVGITTIHDLTWKKFPSLHEASTVAAHEKKLLRTYSLNDVIIVDSMSTKADLISYFPRINQKLIYVIPLGIDAKFKCSSTTEIDAIKRKYNILNNPYILYVGAIEPRKRLELCVQVFFHLVKNKKYSNYQFIIAGRAGWKNEGIFQLVKSLKLDNKVHFIGYIDDCDLPAMYSGAQASLYLSSYEGFGLPPLESLACGTPVLASDNSSVSEYVPHKFLSKSTDPKKLSNTLITLFKFKAKSALFNRSKYSWNEYTSKFIQVIKNN